MKNKKSLLSAAEVFILTGLIAAVSFFRVRYTRANLEISGGEYTAQITTGQIAVALLENDRLVSQSKGSEEVSVHGSILDHLLAEDEKMVAPGKTYDEILSVKNVGNIDEYVRVIIMKRWVNEEGVPITSLAPEFIELNLLAGNDDEWLVDETAATRERTVLYYKKILPVNEKADFADKLTISGEILQSVNTVEKDGVVTVTYDYDGALLELDIEVNGIQTNNGKDAILSAWGVSVEIDEHGNLSLNTGGNENENEQ